jgi:hypothetical protein
MLKPRVRSSCVPLVFQYQLLSFLYMFQCSSSFDVTRAQV